MLFAVGDSRRYVYMSMEEVLAKLNDYALLLSEAQEKDNYANNRPMFTKRLATAAEIYALLHKNDEVTAMDALVQQGNPCPRLVFHRRALWRENCFCLGSVYKGNRY